MATGTTRLADLIVPEVFSDYVQTLTEEKSRLIQSGAVVRDAGLDADIAGGGLVFQRPFFNDLDNDEENVSTDDPASFSTPNKITTGKEQQVRMNRNNSWSSMDLNAALIGTDPMGAIANRVAEYWVRRDQKMFVNTVRGVFANNATAPGAGDLHVQNDMVFDASGAAFADGVTNFSAENFLNATITIGDSMDDLSLVMMHSIVYNRALKNNLIDFIPNSANTYAVPNAAQPNMGIPTFLGRMVIVDDGMPYAVTAGSAVFDTWIFGMGAVQLGMGMPKVPTEVDRAPAAGDGGGQEILYNRIQRIFHPVGHAFVQGTIADGGPSNAELATAANWKRAFRERKMIKMARLITRES
jgi:hypothetical protein